VLLDVDRKAAAKFSFFLAIPTMLGATAYDLYRIGPELAAGDLLTIAVGFAAALLRRWQ
jgi:undecaprenyl-diphosphatase